MYAFLKMNEKYFSDKQVHEISRRESNIPVMEKPLIILIIQSIIVDIINLVVHLLTCHA